MSASTELAIIPTAQPRLVSTRHELSQHDVPGEAAVSDSRTKPLSFYFAFLSLILMVLIASLDTTMLSVALPVVSRQLDGSNTEAVWASLAYILLVAITQPLYTTFSDVTGRKIPLYIAFTMFAIGAIVFATAKSMSIIVLGRAVQGLGGGGLDVLNEIILADLTTLKERPLYMGLMAVPMGVGTVAGPIIGASFAQDASWRWIGWINLPFVGVSASLAVWFLRLKPVQGTIRASLPQLDLFGMLLFALGCPAFAVPVSIAGPDYPWSSWQILLPLTVGLLLLCGLAVYEVRAEYALFPYRLFRTRSASITAFNGFLHGLVLNPLFYWLPLYFQAVILATPLHSALLVLPLCCSLTVAIFLAGFLVNFTRKTRLLSWLAWCLLTIGLGLYSLCNHQSSLVETGAFQILIGIGIGVLFTISPLVMQASMINPDDQGLSVGVLISFRLFGGLIGLAIASTAFSIAFKNSVTSNTEIPATIAVKQNPSVAVAFITTLLAPGLPLQTRLAISTSYLDAMRVIWYFLTGSSCLGLIMSLFIKEVSLETEETGRQHLE